LNKKNTSRIYSTSPFPIFISLLICITLGGCIFVPVLDSIHKIGITKEDRKAKLQNDVKSFLEALYWNNLNSAIYFVSEKNKDELKNSLTNNENKKIASYKIDFYDFDQDAKNAQVNVTLRTYNIGNLIVNDTKETQSWEFSLDKGWKITKRSVRT
jgi:hypothetical protein